jgi:heme-degrading monooxygenase HmoA
MYVQIISFRLRGMAVDEYAAMCAELAPAIAELPGLASKIWLSDPVENAFGGVYSWESAEALDHFKQSDLFRGLASHPKLCEVSSREYSVLEAPTRITRGLVEQAAA